KERSEQHDHDIHRENVEERCLKREGGQANERLNRVAFDLVEKNLVVCLDTGRDHEGGSRHEQRHEHHVIGEDCPCTQERFSREGLNSLRDKAVIAKCGGIAGQEHEYFGGIEERVCPRCEIAEEITRNVINKNKDERQAAEKIDP